MERITHWIDGAPDAGTAERTGVVYNPATGLQSAEVVLASAADLDRAVMSASAAAKEWRSATLSRRSGVLFAFRELLHAHADDLAKIITAEHGKVLSDAHGEIARALENVEFAAGVPQLLKGGFSEQAGTGVDVYSIRQPLGVVAGITPFNFPAMVPLWMAANAIACGNAFILKPSEKDPSASLWLAETWKKAGLPDGIFTVLQGDKSAVDGLLTHPDVAAVSFVGSTPIARYIYETGTAHGKRVQALGGAKNHMVVLPDADIDLAADAAVSAAYGAAGERCMSISVAVAVGDAGDRLVDAIAARLPKLRIGDGADPDTDMGPLITAEHRDKVAGYIGAGAESGATVVVDGREQDVPSDGFFLGTTLLDNVTTDMTVYTDEIFGPVLSVVRADTYDEALAVINSNQFANGTAIFTRDGGAARQFQFDVEVGMVGINVPIPVPVAYYSFGGWKDSLFGDTHMYGPEGINFYTRGKVVTSRWPDPATSTVDLGFPPHPLTRLDETMTNPLASIPTDDATIRALAKAHVFTSWSAQELIDPLPIASAQGSYFTDYAGRRYLDFSSQLVNVNIGYNHPRLVAAIQEYAARFTTIAPSFANDARSEAARLIAELGPGDLNQVFFTNGGAEANENAIRMARLHTGRSKVLATYRSYHGATHGVIGLTGDPRRWGTEPHTIPGMVHFWGPYPYRSSFHSESEEQETERALQHLRETIMVEGAQTIAAIILEPVVGTNGILVPPPGYLAGVREICDETGILLIADEVMSGFARCGEWFAVDHWGVTPDLITFAKGVNSGYVPIGGVLISDAVAETFARRPYPGGLTYSGHPLACASVVASITIMREEGVVENARALGTDVFGPELAKIAARHPSVGEVRGLGAFWAVELVRDQRTREPLVPFNAAGPDAAPMAEFMAACKNGGLWPFTHFNRTHVVPPCTTTAAEAREGLAILDTALDVADQHYTGV